MGIPTYFRQIIKEYPGVHFWDPDMIVDHFLIDFNALIYLIIQLLNEELGNKVNTLSSSVYETKLIDKTVSELCRIVNDVIKPTTSLYIAVDGPPPRAKMVQQRARRYKTIKESMFKRSLEHKYGITIPSCSWNRSSISPGTAFMSKLGKQIIQRIRQQTFKNIKVIFSGDTTPGEGEHKLLEYLKGLDQQSTKVIYSPDADLIVLSIITGAKKVFILREPKDVDGYKDFLYLDIDQCSQYFLQSMNVSSDEKEILTDYAFLTFLCGNDFIMASPFLKMKEGGLHTLIALYHTVHDQLSVAQPDRQHRIIVNGRLHVPFFKQLIWELRMIEEERLQEWQRKRDRIRRSAKQDNMEADKQPWEVELIRFQHEEYYSPLHPFYDTYNRVFDRINYYDPKWIDQYNRYYFHGLNIHDVCRDYLKSLVFCYCYYFTGVPSWTWYYPHRAAPTMRDFHDYLFNNEDALSKASLFEKGEPCTPFEQLMLILPKQYFSTLLPRSIILDQDMLDYYPSNFVLDIMQGTKFIYSEPILPEIPLDVVRNKIKDIEFTRIEQERNTIRPKPFIYRRT